jgi:hypothetical protein
VRVVVLVAKIASATNSICTHVQVKQVKQVHLCAGSTRCKESQARRRSSAGEPSLLQAVPRPAVSIRQHASAYVSIRHHMSAYVSLFCKLSLDPQSAYVSIRQHTSAYVSLTCKLSLEPQSAYVSICQHTSVSPESCPSPLSQVLVSICSFDPRKQVY